jgi:hypothetical protein
MENICWNDFCDGYYNCTNDWAAILSYKGIDILILNTAHGDGDYIAQAYGNQKGAFSVDSGLFCFISYNEALEKAPELIPFFEAKYSKNGNVTFSPTDSCVLDIISGEIKAVEQGVAEGTINVDTYLLL